jgi:HNH endonuclease
VRPAGGNHATLKKYLALWGISTDHFDWGGARPPKREALPLEEVLVEGSNYQRKRLKRRLVEEGLKELRCEMCGQDEMWRGLRMGLILDHVNGVWNDNRLENLRFLCPNCNATLDTHCGRKNRRKVDERGVRILRRELLTQVRQAALLLASLRCAPQRAGATSRRTTAVRPAAGRDRGDELLGRWAQVRRVG